MMPKAKSRSQNLETWDPKAVAAKLCAELQKSGNAVRAAGAKRYLKSQLEFHGVTVPEIRRKARAFAKAEAGLTRAQLRALVSELWQMNVHEPRSLGIGVLEQRVDLLGENDLPWLARMVRKADTWAHVDWLAVKVIGAVVEGRPKTAASLRAWVKDPNFWVRRSALLALHDPLQAGRGDFALFEELATPLLPEREFFIRKAIGWVLRATAKRTPERTIGFVERHAAELALLSFREATRNLKPPIRERLTRLRESSASPPTPKTSNGRRRAS
ncbi:MAG TPA: DNA alkylation repair protein [Polyangiaceae bacterium]|jgi:3-methyladenine DNA glycosylase AlkD|nr:DNA alkylation repair protein [Polyangiaceae bacterium]